MKKRLFIIINGIIFLFIISSGCSLDPDTRLSRALDRYIEKDPEALQDLEQECIRYASIESVEGDDLQSNGTLLYRAGSGRVDIAYPVELTLKLADGGEITQVAAGDAHAAISDGVRIALFTGTGSRISDMTIGDTKSPVRALALDSAGLLYYRNSRVYRYDIAAATSEVMSRETFSSPYTSYYTAMLDRTGPNLCVRAGIAGSYSFSMINRDSGAVVVKNLIMASSRCFLSETAVYYISGSSGKWELTRFDIGTRTKKSLARFTDLVDIVPAAAGYVCETNAGLWAALYGKEKKRIPFTYELAGLYKGRVLLHYRGAYYFIDMARLDAGLQKIMERAPELMTPPTRFDRLSTSP